MYVRSPRLRRRLLVPISGKALTLSPEPYETLSTIRYSAVRRLDWTAILYYTILYYTILYYTILYYTTLYTVLYCTSTKLSCTKLY